MPENNVLKTIIEASKLENHYKPFFIILDEMNLSHVERYFADFLSVMESGKEIPLHPNTKDWEKCDIPANIKLPSNLFIVGTINVDETTYMFSPKVLDRANVIEFRLTEHDIRIFLDSFSSLDLDVVASNGMKMARDFIRYSSKKEINKDDYYNNELLKLFVELKKIGAEFGFRTIIESFKFITIAQVLNVSWKKRCCSII